MLWYCLLNQTMITKNAKTYGVHEDDGRERTRHG